LFIYFSSLLFYDFYYSHRSIFCLFLVVSPFIKCKTEKTFIDRWVLNMDLSHYLELSEFVKLNTAEKLLLCDRMPKHSAGLQQYFENYSEANKVPPEIFEQIFKTGLKGQGLDSDSESIVFAQKGEVVCVCVYIFVCLFLVIFFSLPFC
jgi:hypothetical protein